VVNKVQKIITDDNYICFIILTEGDEDFWYWEISLDTWNKYWKEKNPDCLNGNVTEWAANEFVNSDECRNCGCSVSSFATVEEAVKDYLEKAKM